MKKYMIFILICFLAFSQTACNDTDEEEQQTSEEDTPDYEKFVGDYIAEITVNAVTENVRLTISASNWYTNSEIALFIDNHTFGANASGTSLDINNGEYRNGEQAFTLEIGSGNLSTNILRMKMKVRDKTSGEKLVVSVKATKDN